ncbi:hypothetical protein [Cardinium endosymbiont of Oedothorax gibbosus]|uniref:hypothetical protein n=1 Tax=Cardinium endosymbiont of Oedothorax gibbosus TaxID=931101 RepID=UPI002024BF02|nr:hypothetical protein [Cardinium endosymbiont of Oedothorax gibbosus]
MKPKTTKQVFDFFPGMWKMVRRVTVEIPEQNAIANGYRSHLFKKVVKKIYRIALPSAYKTPYLPDAETVKDIKRSFHKQCGQSTE